MLAAIDRFSLEPSGDSLKSKLVDSQDHSIALAVFGKDLEAQFCDDQSGFCLLVLTDDCPYEETLRLALVSPSGQLVDELERSPAYESLVVDRVSVTRQNVVEIYCSGQRIFRAEYRAQAFSFFAAWMARLSGSVVGKKNHLFLSK